ncbi:MAG TPA: hypothetical protein DEQ02_00830 [Ruminococcaceae bacterium]|nr:hypothetical protein [Oscillospiraceae bacterium]
MLLRKHIKILKFKGAKRMKKNMRHSVGKRILSAFLALVTAVGLYAGTGLSAAAEDEPLPYVKAEKGLWITEIYQNDVSREAVYGTASDLMEFVEIVNTSGETIIFNDTHTIWYEYLSGGQMITQVTPLTVYSNDEADTSIAPGETVIIRDRRPDLPTEQYPSDDDFRKTMDVKPGVKIWSVSGQNGWAENARGFSIRLKSDKNKIFSRFIYNMTVAADGTVEQKTDTETQDGLSVQLSIPDYGYEMLSWEVKTMPTPGYVYNAQYNGQYAVIPDESAPKGLFITEVLPQDSSSATSARFGSGGNQILEFVELTNTTDRDINLNEEYQLTYFTKMNNGTRTVAGGNDKITVITSAGDPYDDTCIIPAGKSVVLWVHREQSNTAFLLDKYGVNMGMLTQRENAAPGVTTVYDTWPTEADFREIRGIAADVPVFTIRNINGCGNDRNAFALRKIITRDTENPSLVTKFVTELVSSYGYDTANRQDTSGGRSASLGVSPEGSKMLCYQAAALPSPGTVAPEQLTYLTDDGKTPVIREWDGIPAPSSIDQGSFYRTPYYYENVKTIELYYKPSNQETFTKLVSSSFSIYNKWYTFVPGDKIVNADYFDYYIKAKGVYNTAQTDMKRVQINRVDNGEGLRVNLDGKTVSETEAETVSGTVNITAKNFADTGAPVTMTLDGGSLPISAAMEKGAFFTFTHDGGNGLDSYFKNALVVKSHEDDDFGDIIRLFPAHSEAPGLASMAIMVDSKYFTYNPDGSASIELYIYAGTHGSTFESFTAENNDDFTAQWVRLSLADGTTFKPVEYKGFQVTTGAGGAGTQKNGWVNLDPDAQIRVGDSNNLHVYVKSRFEIPAESLALDAYASKIDTTALSDGEHTLAVTSGGVTKTVTLDVDNIPPVQPEPERLPETDLGFELDPEQNPVKATVAAGEGDKEITLFEAKEADITKVYEGVGDSTSAAAEKTGDGATVSANGEFPYQIYELDADAEQTDSMRFDVAAKADYGRDVQLYALNVNSGVWEILEAARNGDEVTAVFPLENRIQDGKVKVLVQARGTEFAPYTRPNSPATVKNNYPDEWTGEGEHAVPKQYDFSMAWITDTQYYAEQYTHQFQNITDWIVEKKDELNIKYVTHTGDIADEWDEEYQFINASKYLKKFEDANIPYGVLGGNHDVAFGAEKYDNYWKYFGEERYGGNSYYGGSYKNNLGHYDLITIDGVEMIFVYMSWDIYYPETEWINEVLAKYSDRKAVIAVHCGINANAAQSYQSNMLLREVCSKNENVFAMINGHYHGSSLNFAGFDDDSDGVNDRVVYQICTDYQSAPEGGSGYVKMLYFDLANDKIYLNSYSPSVDDYNYYDLPKLPEYPVGLNISNIDITQLEVDFDRETAKSLTVSGARAAVFTNTELGGAAADGLTKVEFESEKGISKFAYAVTSDENGRITAYSDAVQFTVPAKIYKAQENDPGLAYSGSWGDRAQIGRFDGHLAKQASKIGSSVSFTFKGTGFKIVSYKSYSQGIFDVYIDGEKKASVNNYEPGSDASFQNDVYKNFSLPDGVHTVTITISGRDAKSIGSNIYIDAVHLAGSFVKPSTLMDDQAVVVSAAPVEIDVLANDGEVSGDIELLEEDLPESGEVKIVNGKLVFTPHRMAVKDETFTYRAGDATATVTLVYANIIRYEETFKAVADGKNAGGAWESFSFARYSGGSAIRSGKKGDTLEITFYGTGIEIIGYKSWSRGKAEITLDGAAKTIDTHDMSYDRLYDTSVYNSGTIIEGTHTLKIKVLDERNILANGSAIDIDAFVVSK